ncbi:Zn-ribbon domain-containing OB-fold protein [Embleya scabrispora]|uniref:Zn-ribbon domain-containing OB-fold protein n=1 Tax=Embleya scabrispora TaxID=159449 RepID=UPI00035D851C|nr:OB-fold domain-containing protein [Embleya scabrispora]MYS79228.1 DNA-binding protein [Streptomyces sp. SID5474]
MSGFEPTPTPETAPYWDAAARGDLSVQFCLQCARHYFYPRPACPRCGGESVEWRTVAGRARLVSYVINHRPLPPFDATVPQIVALVELDEGPRMMTAIVGVEPAPEHLPLDLALEVAFVDCGDVRLPVFKPMAVAA